MILPKEVLTYDPNSNTLWGTTWISQGPGHWGASGIELVWRRGLWEVATPSGTYCAPTPQAALEGYFGPPIMAGPHRYYPHSRRDPKVYFTEARHCPALYCHSPAIWSCLGLTADTPVEALLMALPVLATQHFEDAKANLSHCLEVRRIITAVKAHAVGSD